MTLVPAVRPRHGAVRNAVAGVHQRDHRLADSFLLPRLEQSCVNEFPHALAHLGACRRVHGKSLQPLANPHLDSPAADAFKLFQRRAYVSEQRRCRDEVPYAKQKRVGVLASTVQRVGKLCVDVVLRLCAIELCVCSLNLWVLQRRVHPVDDSGEAEVVSAVLNLVLESPEGVARLVQPQAVVHNAARQERRERA